MEKKRFWLLVGILVAVAVLILFLMPDSEEILPQLFKGSISLITTVWQSLLLLFFYYGSFFLGGFGWPKIVRELEKHLIPGKRFSGAQRLLLSFVFCFLTGAIWLVVLPWFSFNTSLAVDFSLMEKEDFFDMTKFSLLVFIWWEAFTGYLFSISLEWICHPSS